jgi:hypothetical protein
MYVTPCEFKVGHCADGTCRKSTTSWKTGRRNPLLRQRHHSSRQKTKSAPQSSGWCCRKHGVVQLLTPKQSHRPKVSHCNPHRQQAGHEPRLVQFLQLHCKRDAQREGNRDAPQIWRRTLRTTRLLRHAGRAHADGAGYRRASRHTSLYRLCSGLLHHFQRHTCLLKAWRYHRCRQSRQLFYSQRPADLQEHCVLVRT